MKRGKIILEIESENGIETHSVDVKNQEVMDNMTYIIFSEDYGIKLTNKKRLEIINNTSNGQIIYWVMPDLTSNLSNKKIEELFEKFKNDKDAQLGILRYCARKAKVTMLKKIAKQGVTGKVRAEARMFLKIL